jgi:hypothetical protein
MDDSTREIEVAIKIPKLSSIRHDSLQDFYLEAKTAINFDHTNILECLGISNGKLIITNIIVM